MNQSISIRITLSHPDERKTKSDNNKIPKHVAKKQPPRPQSNEPEARVRKTKLQKKKKVDVDFMICFKKMN